MTLNIDKDILDKVKAGIIDKKRLESFDSTLCCDIIKKSSTFLIVKPTSFFKSSNCSYCHTISNKGTDVHVCSCPVRLELYQKHGK